MRNSAKGSQETINRMRIGHAFASLVARNNQTLRHTIRLFSITVVTLLLELKHVGISSSMIIELKINLLPFEA